MINHAAARSTVAAVTNRTHGQSKGSDNNRMIPSRNRRTTYSPACWLAILTIAIIASSLSLGGVAVADDLTQAGDQALLSCGSTSALGSTSAEPAWFIPPLDCRLITPRFVYLPSVTENANTVSHGTVFSHSAMLSHSTMFSHSTMATSQRFVGSSRLRRLPPVAIVCAQPTAVHER